MVVGVVGDDGADRQMRNGAIMPVSVIWDATGERCGCPKVDGTRCWSETNAPLEVFSGHRGFAYKFNLFGFERRGACLELSFATSVVVVPESPEEGVARVCTVERAEGL